MSDRAFIYYLRMIAAAAGAILLAMVLVGGLITVGSSNAARPSPGSTVTVTRTVTAPGPTVTQTFTQTVTATTTVFSTVTQTAPGPTVTVTVTPSPSMSPSPTPSPSQTQSGLLVGLNDHPIWLRQSQDTAWNYILQSHAKALRIDLPMDTMMWAGDGQWDSTRIALIDDYMNKAQAAGIVVDAIVLNTAAWACGGCTDAHAGNSITPANYVKYLQYVLNRWPQIDAVEIWNEPDGGWAWTSPDPVRYAALVKAAYPAVKAINPNIKVLAPSLSGPNRGSYLSTFYAQGTQPYFDGFAVHGYWWSSNNGTWPQTATQIFNAFNSNVYPTMVANGDANKPVWWTETGIYTSGGSTNETDQANMVDDIAAHTGLIKNLVGVWWYDFKDDGPASQTGQEQNFGLINMAGTSVTLPNPSDFQPKPAFSHFQTWALAN